MSIVLEFVLYPGLGEAVEACVRGHLENYFSQIELTMEPLYGLIVDDEGRMVTIPEHTRYRFVANGPRQGFRQAELEVRLHPAIAGCFDAASTSPVYHLTIAED